MREWKLLFEEGKPLYPVAPNDGLEDEEPSPEQILEEDRQQLLDEGDFNEYRVNPILCYIIIRFHFELWIANPILTSQ